MKGPRLTSDNLAQFGGDQLAEVVKVEVRVL